MARVRWAAVAVGMVASLCLGVTDAVADPTLYVTNYDATGGVVPVPLSTLAAGSAITVGVGGYTGWIAITPDASLGFAPNLNPAVGAISTATNTSTQVTHATLTSPGSAAVSPDGSQVYVGNVNGTTVAVINAHTLVVSPSAITVGASPWGVAFTPDGTTAYTANTAGTVSVIDTASRTVTKTITTNLPNDPCGLTVTPNGSRVVVIGGCNAGTGGISIINTATNTATAVAVPNHQFPAQAMAPDGSKDYVVDAATGNIELLDPQTGTLASTPLENGLAGVQGLALSPNGFSLFATRLLSGTVSDINTATGAITPISPVSAKPWADAVTPDQAPHAALAVSPSPAGALSALSAAATTTDDGGPATYVWDFGDGGSDTTSSPTTTHTYAQPGDYTATVTVTDDQGCSTAFVFTGQTASCNGGPAARASQGFSVAQPQLVLNVFASGPGTVSGPGISCPGDCSQAYDAGTAVTLNASAARHAKFMGWSGNCTGQGACQLTMSANRNVAATFSKPPNTKITHAQINSAAGTASFRFKAATPKAKRPSTTFQCALVRGHAKPRFRRCRSPKAYRALSPGSYTFEVRATTAAGRDPTPAHKHFKIAAG